MESLTEYLKPTLLCDFDRAPEIRSTAQRLTFNKVEKGRIFDCLYNYVKELPFGLEDWDVKASQTLSKQWGMCSGKSNLLVALCRAAGLAARYKVLKIKPEEKLWDWIISSSRTLAEMVKSHSETDHVMVQVYLDRWEDCDPSRDTPFEKGLVKLGIPLERKLITNPDGQPCEQILASFDRWAVERQKARRYKENRDFVFSLINKQLDKIRALASPPRL
jgi:transglutaminase-like putative cysteine protease